MTFQNHRVEEILRMYQEQQAANEDHQPQVKHEEISAGLLGLIKSVMIFFFQSNPPLFRDKAKSSSSRRIPAREILKPLSKKKPSVKVPGLKQGDLTRSLNALHNFLDEYLKKTGARNRMEKGTTIFEWTHGVEDNIFRFHYYFFDTVNKKVCCAKFDVIPGDKDTCPEIKVVEDHRTGKGHSHWKIRKVS